MFSTDSFKNKDCDIKTIDLLDHSPISMSLILEWKTRVKLWRLNSHILNDPKMREKLKGEALTTPERYRIAILWDILKAVLRGKIKSITTCIKKLQGQTLVDLQGKLQ